MKFFHWFMLVLPVCFFSCTPVQRLPGYLESGSDTTGQDVVIIPEVQIKKNDLLSIQIHSLSTRPQESDMIYNQFTQTATPSGTTPVMTTGYLVDNNGNIEHHRLGLIKAEGLTKQQLADEIKKRLTVPVELLKDPTVIIRFLNYKVVVLGEVMKPGTIPVPNERMTILEAIGLAGDVSQYGLKNNIKVIREQDGKILTGTIDLSSKNFFSSPPPASLSCCS